MYEHRGRSNKGCPFWESAIFCIIRMLPSVSTITPGRRLFFKVLERKKSMHCNILKIWMLQNFKTYSHTGHVFIKKSFTVGVHKNIFASKAVFSFKISLWTYQHIEGKHLQHFFCVNVRLSHTSHNVSCVTWHVWHVINQLNMARVWQGLNPLCSPMPRLNPFCTPMPISLTPVHSLPFPSTVFALQPHVPNNSG